MNDFHLIAVSCSSLHELVTQQKNDQLPVDLLTQLVGHYSDIAEGSTPVQNWISFFKSKLLTESFKFVA